MDNTPINGREQAVGKLTGMIGLARRAGKLTFGFDAVLQDIETGKAKAILLSSDAAERTAGKIKAAGERKKSNLAVIPLTKVQLGLAIGRDDTAVVSINDKSFAGRILDLARAGSFLEGKTNPGGNQAD
jgi:ribosomal protein L7Ae-like RNA K-turn-binding protein